MRRVLILWRRTNTKQRWFNVRLTPKIPQRTSKAPKNRTKTKMARPTTTTKVMRSRTFSLKKTSGLQMTSSPHSALRAFLCWQEAKISAPQVLLWDRAWCLQNDAQSEALPLVGGRDNPSHKLGMHDNGDNAQELDPTFHLLSEEEKKFAKLHKVREWRWGVEIKIEKPEKKSLR